MKIENLKAQAYDTVVITGIYHPHTKAFYAMSNGGMFNVVDLNNKLIYFEYLEDTTATWAHSYYENMIYGVSLRQSGPGFLWQFDTSSQKLKRLVDLPDGHQAWSLAVLDHNNIFVGSYKEQDAHVFQYSDERLSSLHQFTKEYSYVRSLAVSEQSLYIGTGQNGRVFAYDFVTKKINTIDHDLAKLLNKPLETLSFTYDMFYTNGKLFCRLDQSHTDVLGIYDETTKTWHVIKDKKSSMFNQLPHTETDIYLLLDQSWHRFNYKTGTLSDLELPHTYDPRGACIIENQIMTIGRQGELYRFNTETKEKTRYDSVMKPLPLTLHNLGQDHLGNLYLSSYPGGPKLIQRSSSGVQEIAFPQVEGFAHNEKDTLYLGVYPGAKIYALDPNTLQHQLCFNLKDHYQQDRPYIMKYLDDKLYIGTIPDYKQRGGVLALYDPKLNKKKVYRNLIKNQSIVGIAKQDDIIYLSSTIRGGLDSVWPQEKPKIIKFNLKNETIELETTLEIEGLSGKIMISALTIHNDILWCVSDGYVIGLNPKTLKTSKVIVVQKDVQDCGMWKPYQLIHYKNDVFITDLAGGIFTVDLKRGNIKELVSIESKVSFMTYLDKSIYYLDQEDTYLKRINL